jgi:hypothetical protein
MNKMATTLSVCIGHKRPEFTLWNGVFFATYQESSDADWVLDVDPDLIAHLPDGLVGEYHYLFALRRQLERDNDLDRVVVCQYRRYVSCYPQGVPSSNHPWTSVVTPSEASGSTANSLIPSRGDWLTTSAINCLPNVSAQFAQHHPIRDWFRFLADSGDAAILSSDEIYQASHLSILMPAPSNGCFPTPVLIEHLRRLECCALAFLRSGYRPYDGYQRRIIGFCLERLHTFLILQSLAKFGINLPDVLGHQITVSDTETVIPTI